jgi:SPP1 family predicted phage head-tail adaptor
MSLNAGRLDQRITPQQRVDNVNGFGENDPTWANVDAGSGEIWARADPKRGREYFAAAQLQAEGPVAFEVRYRADLHERMRVMWRGVPYEIVSPPVDEYGHRESLFLYCVTGIRDGRTT